MNAKDLKLDYFQIYNFENPLNVSGVSSSIWLKGQFDENGPEFARLRSLRKLLNPVEKNEEGFFNKKGHLVWYNIESSGMDNTIAVRLTNQFGEQKIVIYRDLGLLVPARKKVLQSHNTFTKATKLDHYKVYRVIDHSGVERRSLKLVDQFQKRKADLGDAVAFAVPVKKRHDGKEFPILNEKAHLVIYRISYSKNMPQIVDTRDQFSRYRCLKVGRSYLLAVPSIKNEWQIID